jgi:hypothetical protein
MFNRQMQWGHDGKLQWAPLGSPWVEEKPKEEVIQHVKEEEPKKETRLAWTVGGKPCSARILKDGRVLETRRAGKTFHYGLEERRIRPRIWPSEAAWAAEIDHVKDDEATPDTYLCETPEGLRAIPRSSYRMVEVTLPPYATHDEMVKGVDSAIRNTVGGHISWASPTAVEDLVPMISQVLPPSMRQAFDQIMGIAKTSEFVPVAGRQRPATAYIHTAATDRWCPIYMNADTHEFYMIHNGRLHNIHAPSALKQSGIVTKFLIPL